MSTNENIFDAPANHLWATFEIGKWEHEFARNALLNFIDEKGLTDEVVKWIKERADNT